MVTIIKGDDYKKIGKIIRPDGRRRVALPKSLIKDGISFQVWANSEGQILLEPQVTIPASELWVFENKEILASLDKAMFESMNGQTVNRGSFAKYVEDEA
ncbi:MAG TPA: hypothetical protein G4O18_00810 [Dehalococcoidia bacterium]|nr:hypothetical protein [Dehalococcoidia bacterium]